MTPCAVGELFAEEREKLVSYGMGVCADFNLVEDVVQELFEDLLRFDIGLRGDLTQPTFTWLRTRVRYKIYEAFRRRRIPTETLEAAELIPGREQTEAAAINIIYLDAVRKRRPKLLEDLVAMEAVMDDEGTRGTRAEHRQHHEYKALYNRISRARVRLQESIEQYIIGAYFGGEYHGNDLGESR